MMTRDVRLLGAVVAWVLACSEAKDIGSGIDDTSGTPENLAETGGSPAMTAPTGGFAEGGGVAGLGSIGEASCELTEDVHLVDVEALNSSEWPTDCSNLEREYTEQREALKAAVLDVEPLAGRWLEVTADTRTELVVDRTGAGTIVFGSGQLPKLDVRGAYLSEVGPRDIDGYSSHDIWDIPDGAQFPLIAVSGRASEMTAKIVATAPWAEWCAAQAPIRGPFCFACEMLPRQLVDDRPPGLLLAGSDCGDRVGCYVGDFGDYARVDCGRLALCKSDEPVCRCTQQECFNDPSSTTEFTLTLDATDANVLRLTGNILRTRYLERQL